MSYTVFALKWRPNRFEDIVGQDHVVLTLKNAIQKDKLAHAYLFAGPRGVGKTSTARILAKSLNCKDGPTATPCQQCPSCVQISQGRSLDVIEIDGASNTGIDNIRDLRESIKFSPASGKFKIYIIDEVHMLSDSAFNALLKTLEEPPPYVKFVFATTHPHEIIPTVLSRCQRLDFRRIPVVEIIAQLERIAREEQIKADKEVLVAIAQASDGALRDAESLLDQLASFSKGVISLKDVISVLGVIEQETLFEITEKIIQKDTPGALALFNKVIEEGKDTKMFLRNLTGHFRNLMVAKVTKADFKLIDLPQEVCNKLLTQSQHFSIEEILAIFNILVNTQEMTKRLESARIPLEICLVKLTHSKKSSGEQPAFLTGRPQGVPDVSGKAPSVPVKNKDEKPQAPQRGAKREEQRKEESMQQDEPMNSISVEQVHDAWPEIIESLGKVKMSVATYLNEGNPLRIEHNVLTIAFPQSHSLHKESLEGKENRALVEKTFSELLNVRLRVSFILSKETVVTTVSDMDSEILKSAMNAFGARVINN
jgi:DNA polymerase-3 subunit gamma/tau